MRKIILTFVFLSLAFILSTCRDHSRHIPEFSVDESDDIISNWISVSKPDYGAVWEPGTTHEIKWESNTEIVTVNIDLYKKGSKLHTITAGIDNSGSFIWEIDENITQTNHAQIRVSSYIDGALEGFSEVFYLIKR